MYLHIINSINDSRIKIVINEKKHGYTSNFYNCLKYANGDYIFLSDQDDIWLPQKVEKTMEYLKVYDFVVSDAVEVDAKLQTIKESRFESYKVKRGFITNLCRSRYIGCCMAFNKNVLNSLYPVPSYKNDYPHDLWISLIAEKYFNTALIREPLILYRRHGKNESNGGDSKNNNRKLSQKIKSRFYYIKYVYKQRDIIRRKKGLKI